MKIDGTTCETAQPGKNRCVAQGISIATPQGPKLVESLKVGDKVWGFDPDRDEPVVVKVTRVEATTAKQTIRIDRLRVTPEHPIMVGRQWKAAEQIKVGDPLFTEQQTEGRVSQIEQLAGDVVVYDLQVDQPHNFFAAGVLVHNAS